LQFTKENRSHLKSVVDISCSILIKTGQTPFRVWFGTDFGVLIKITVFIFDIKFGIRWGVVGLTTPFMPITNEKKTHIKN